MGVPDLPFYTELRSAGLLSNEPGAGEYSAHDREMLDFFYPCFDRAAFRIPFLVEVPRDMIHAIKGTISALGTGIRKQSDGTIIAQCRPKTDFQSIELRQAFDNISEHLHDISKVYELAVATNQLKQTEGVIYRIDEAIPVIIDRKRNEIINIVNQVYTRPGRIPFPLIPNDRDSKYGLFDQLRAKYWEEEGEERLYRNPKLHNRTKYPIRLNIVRFLRRLVRLQ